MDYRIGIDVMTTETACLSSIWQTDEKVEEYLAVHGRPETYQKLEPEEGALYDSVIEIDLGKIEPMVAMPFHPSRAFTVRDVQANGADILRQTELLAHEQFGGKVELHLTDKLKNGKLLVDQGIIAGCSGGMYDNIAEAAAILDGQSIGDGYFSLSIYPPSIPINLELMKNGIQQTLLEAGALFKPCFCGPCFGAGDVPGNDALSIRHTTRNFPNREGSKPASGQLSGVMLMDARSIAATARNHGVLTAATDIDYTCPRRIPRHSTAASIRNAAISASATPTRTRSFASARTSPSGRKIPALPENLLMELACVIHDPVTTTDELIPSGETSSYRSNPLKLATFALSRRDPQYVGRANAIAALESARKDGTLDVETAALIESCGGTLENTGIGSVIFANKPGDGSAREQAASCQRVLGGCANICYEYATKRYRSNCINWGMLPFHIDLDVSFMTGYLHSAPNVSAAVRSGSRCIPAMVIRRSAAKVPLLLHLAELTADERQILLDGCLMNYYAANHAKENA